MCSFTSFNYSCIDAATASVERDCGHRGKSFAMLWEIASLLRRHSPAAWKHAAVDQLLNVYFLLSIHIMLMVVNDVTIKYFLD